MVRPVCALVCFVATGCSFPGASPDPSGEPDSGTTDASELQPDAMIGGQDGGEGLVCGSADPIADELVACFEFENSIAETIGVVPATESIGTPVYEAGQRGQALVLADNRYVRNDGHETFEKDASTGGLWIKVTGLPTGGRVTLIDLQSRFGIFLVSDGVRCNGQYGQITAGTVTPNEWMHVACRHSPTNGEELFINGEQIGCTNDQNGSGAVTPQPFFIGANSPGGGDELTGSVDTVRFFGRALSDQELCAAAGRESCDPPAENCDNS